MRIEARYDGVDKNGHHILHDVTGDITRDHAFLNGSHSNFPDNIKPGSRVRFYASLHHRGPKPARLSDVRECQVLSE